MRGERTEVCSDRARVEGDLLSAALHVRPDLSEDSDAVLDGVFERRRAFPAPERHVVLVAERDERLHRVGRGRRGRAEGDALPLGDELLQVAGEEARGDIGLVVSRASARTCTPTDVPSGMHWMRVTCSSTDIGL